MKAHSGCAIISCLLMFVCVVSTSSCGDPTLPTGWDSIDWLPVTEDVSGTLTEIGGVPVLRVWGTPYEQGYANTYLTAPDVYEVYLEACEKNGLTDDVLQNQFFPLLSRMILPARYEQELRGMLDGLEARAGGALYMPPLERALTFEDLFVGHIVTELNDLNCSSFTAWGSMTPDGSLIGGTNREWFDDDPVRRSHQIVIVRIPTVDSGRLAWLAVDHPGSISCGKCINEEGVFVHQHDAQGHPRTVDSGFLQDDLFFREVVEQIHANASGDDIRNLLVPFVTNDGTNMMVGMPFSGGNVPSHKLELDGDEAFESGVSICEPDPPRPYRISTSHFRTRLAHPPPVATPRFNYLYNQLEGIFSSASLEHLTEDQVWQMLQDATIPGYTAVHRIVYEPNQMRMHIALLRNGESASEDNVVTLDLQELFSRDR